MLLQSTLFLNRNANSFSITLFSFTMCVSDSRVNMHLIQKRLSSELLHCALLHTQTASHIGCKEFLHCCMPRPKSIVVHIASMANTRISLSHSRHLQCYFEIRYIDGALRSGYATVRNAQCNNSEDNIF